MKSKWGTAAKVGLLALAFMGNLCAQSANHAAADTAAARVAAPSSLDGDVLREIDDPTTGNRWLVLRNPKHPAGPGRVVLTQPRTNYRERNSQATQPVRTEQGPIIRTGDVVTVEEHTPLLDLRLQAVALEPSLTGAYFTARLKIGGKVMRVMALAPGRAVFGPESEVNP